MSSFKDATAVKSVRMDLENSNLGLAAFEVAQIGNLCPADAEEARALIPSLNRDGRHIDNGELDEVLKKVQSKMAFS